MTPITSRIISVSPHWIQPPTSIRPIPHNVDHAARFHRSKLNLDLISGGHTARSHEVCFTSVIRHWRCASALTLCAPQADLSDRSKAPFHSIAPQAGTSIPGAY